MNFPSLHHVIDLDAEIHGEKEVGRKSKRKADFSKQPDFNIFFGLIKEGHLHLQIFLFSIISVVAEMSMILFLGKWVSSYYYASKDIYLIIYLSILAFVVMLYLLKSHLQGIHFSRTSYQIHVKMIYSLLRRPSLWFKKYNTDKFLTDYTIKLDNIDTIVADLVSKSIKFIIACILGVLLSMSIMPLLINLMAGVLVFWSVSNAKFYRTCYELF